MSNATFLGVVKYEVGNLESTVMLCYSKKGFAKLT